jgi:very-short-patch-repair endonuclease
MRKKTPDQRNRAGYHNDLKHGAPKRSRVGAMHVCPACGKSFYLTPCRAARGERFCSQECRLSTIPKVDKVCPVCQQVFRVNASTAHRYSVCSLECRHAITLRKTCLRCGKIYRAEKRLNRHYCSEECRRPPKLINCKTCSRQFRATPSDANRRFCSFSCYRKSTGETLLECKVRQVLEANNVDYVQEHRIGRYSVDFYLPQHSTALEVDGDYWHRDPRRDLRKERFLNQKGVPVARIKETEIEHMSTSQILRLIRSRIRNARTSLLQELA